MSEFFRGWRRKVGVVTLMMACVLTGMWVRSMSVIDNCELPVGKHSVIIVFSYIHFCAVLAEHDPDFNSSSAQWLSKPTPQLTPVELAGASYENLKMPLKYRNHPPIVPKGRNQPILVPNISQDYRLIGMPFSYWFALPLTLLSAWLLIIKPRPTTSEQSIEPKSENVASIKGHLFKSSRMRIGLVTLVFVVVSAMLYAIRQSGISAPDKANPIEPPTAPMLD